MSKKTIKFAPNSHLERHLRCASYDRPNARNKGEASRDNPLQVLGRKDVWGREEMTLLGALAMVAMRFGLELCGVVHELLLVYQPNRGFGHIAAIPRV